MILRRRCLLYSATDTIDLSMVDTAGNEREFMTTANCYLVHSAGKYKLPLVYGNAIKDGLVNTIAFYPNTTGQLTRFLNHNGDGITGPWITKNGSDIDSGMGLVVASAVILWQDKQGLIKNVSINGDYLEFTVGSFGGGNALIAVRDSSSNILWSWHIWATEEDLLNTTIVSTGSHNYAVAPVNLGWVPTNESNKQGYCPYYQWGRKDPFIPASAYNKNTNHTVYAGSTVKTFYFLLSNNATIADTIKRPTYFYYNSNDGSYVTTFYYNMWDAQNKTTAYNTATATKKTIYDPCPPGFCVPTGNLVYYFTNDGSRTMSTWDNTNKGAVWNTNIVGENLYFPAAGWRDKSSGNLQYVGSNGIYWSASPNPSISTGPTGYVFSVSSSTWGRGFNRTSTGQSVRPVVEE